jgi:formamidopyrimidine-DNA glycosylase
VPELPEVETIVNELSPMVCGKHIQRVEFLWPKTLLSPGAEEFATGIDGHVISALTRRGKYLVFMLDSGRLMLVHLRMTGSLRMVSSRAPVPGHTRAIIHLEHGQDLVFIDPRKFGKFQLAEPGCRPLAALGVEPLEPDFTAGALANILAGRRCPVKSVLLNQTLIAGVGNMYADEALFAAGIHPGRTAAGLLKTEVEHLHTAVIKVLRDGIEAKGASISNYFRPGGETGRAHISFNVAHRRKGKCHRCGALIERIVIQQRGTYFCPKCQPETPGCV